MVTMLKPRRHRGGDRMPDIASEDLPGNGELEALQPANDKSPKGTALSEAGRTGTGSAPGEGPNPTGGGAPAR